MSEPYIGQVQSFGFGFAPKGWAQCNGQLLPINQNAALFSLLGTFYGGNGTTTFALPNLQGRFVAHVGTDPVSGSTVVQGQAGGEATHTLTLGELAGHTHPLMASSATGTSATPVNNFPAPAAGGASLFGPTVNTTLGTGSNPTGGGQPHENRPPYLVINYCIALQGIFPSRN